jgi:hypothetical protein
MFKFRSSGVVLRSVAKPFESLLRLLDNADRVSVTFENVCHRLPSGATGEGAVDQNDTLDGRQGGGCRRQRGAFEENQNQVFHGAAPVILATVIVDVAGASMTVYSGLCDEAKGAGTSFNCATVPIAN